MLDSGTKKKLDEQFQSGDSRAAIYLDTIIRTLGINYNEYRFIKLLSNNPEGIEPSVIAEKLSLQRQMVTYIINGLEKKGYLSRDLHPTDKRRILLTLTAEGKTILQSCVDLVNRYHEKMSEYIPEDVIRDYIRIRETISEGREKAVQELLREIEK